MATAALPRFSFGSTVTDTFRTTGRNFMVLLGLAMLLYALPSIVFTIATFSAFNSALTDPANFDTMFTSAFGPAILGGSAVSMLLYVLVQGAMTHVSLRFLYGERAGFGEALAAGFRNFFPLLAISIIYYVALVALIGVLILGGALIVGGIAEGAGNVGLAIAMAFIYFFAACFPLLFLVIVWMVPVPARMTEGIGIFAAFRRSWSLTRGHRWKLLAMVLLFWTAMLMLYGTLSLAAMPFMVFGAASTSSPLAGLLPMTIIQTLLGAFALVLIYPAIAATYYNLRNAREGVSQNSIADIFG